LIIVPRPWQSLTSASPPDLGPTSPRPGSPQAIHRGRQLEAPRQDVEGARLAAAQGVQALLAHLGRLGEKDEDFTGKPCETMGKWRLMGRMEDIGG